MSPLHYSLLNFVWLLPPKASHWHLVINWLTYLSTFIYSVHVHIHVTLHVIWDISKVFNLQWACTCTCIWHQFVMHAFINNLHVHVYVYWFQVWSGRTWSKRRFITHGMYCIYMYATAYLEWAKDGLVETIYIYRYISGISTVYIGYYILATTLFLAVQTLLEMDVVQYSNSCVINKHLKYSHFIHVHLHNIYMCMYSVQPCKHS